MGFEDRLRNALDAAVAHYNDGCTPDEAVCKSACESGFNQDQTDRLVEVMNTAITLNQYKKAEDRTASFPIAHKDRVASMMLDADTVLGKKASCERGPYVYFDYMTGPARNQRSGEPIEKVAGFEEPGSLDGVSADDLAHSAMRQITMRKNASAYARGLEASLHGQLVSDMHELADSVRRFGSEKYAQFKAACKSKDIVERLERVLPASFSSVKEASGLVDDTVFEKELGLADCMHENYAFMKEMHKQAADLSAEADRMRSELVAACVEKSAAPAPGGGTIPKSWFMNQLVYGTQGVNPAGVIHSEAVPDVLSSILFPNQRGAMSRAEEELDNDRRSILLQNLMATDDVLKEADPDIVASAYETLVRNAPGVSKDKEVVRSVLRQAVQSVAISPFDVDSWAKLDTNAGKANSGRRHEEATA